MIHPDKIFGRLGNRMFQMAALLSATDTSHTGEWFFQDEALFSTIAPQIRQLYGQNIGSVPYVAIHVRRGDYLDPAKGGWHTNLCATNYYWRAMEHFPDARFLVFSDDKEWARTYFVTHPDIKFSEYQDEVADLNIMASCHGHIIANSSFSWWGAWLSPHGGPVIAPREDRWTKDGVPHCKLPKHWRQIDFN
jgi:hypothetical protein